MNTKPVIQQYLQRLLIDDFITVESTDILTQTFTGTVLNSNEILKFKYTIENFMDETFIRVFTSDNKFVANSVTGSITFEGLPPLNSA